MPAPPTRCERPNDLAEVDLATVMAALADPVRLQIVQQLAAFPGCSCGKLDVPVAKSTLSHHLKMLLAAGLVDEQDAGTRKLLCLREQEVEARFPGLLTAVLRSAAPAPS